MSGLTNAAATALIAASNGTAALTAPTAPLKLAVESTAGNTTSPGTELANTTRPALTMGAPSGTPPVASNSAACTVVVGTGNSSVSVGAQAIYDSAGTPFRWWWGPLAAARTVSAGDSLAFAIGAITQTLTS